MEIAGGEHMIPVLSAIWGIIQTGLVLSCGGLGVYSTQSWLSKYTTIEEPDPTAFKRPFDKLFDNLFAPAGWAAAERVRSTPLRQVSFQLSVGVVVLLFASITYLATASLMIGTTAATYQLSGLMLNPVPAFRQVVAFIVVFGSAITFHAGDRAKQIDAQQTLEQ